MTPLLLAILVFAGAAILTVLGSIRLAGLGDVLADRTGWGEAIFGAPVLRHLHLAERHRHDRRLRR